jgi:hypothetical protein
MKIAGAAAVFAARQQIGEIESCTEIPRTIRNEQQHQQQHPKLQNNNSSSSSSSSRNSLP